MATQSLILTSIEVIDAALKGAADVDPIYLTTTEKAAALRLLTSEVDRLQELRLRVLASADDVAEEHGARSTGVWLAHETGNWAAEGRRQDRVAAALEAHPDVRRAVADGQVSLAQAQVVCTAVDAIPAELGVEIAQRAEGHLIGLCDDYGPKELRRLAEHILEVVAPEIAEAEEQRRIEALEASAQEASRLTVREQGDGTTRISALIPSTTAAVFSAQLEAYTSPRRVRDGFDGATGKRLPHARQLGEAFCELIETRRPDNLPHHGGGTVAVVATIDHASLIAGVGTTTLTSGERLSVGAVRRLACKTGVLPAVLGGKSEVLDLGRRQRLFTMAQHRALAIRDRGCRALGCDIPAAWTEAHHKDPWSAGGKTDLADGVLLCSRHHHVIHDPRYDHTWLANGRVSFHRRT
jgi:hypothetical protein